MRLKHLPTLLLPFSLLLNAGLLVWLAMPQEEKTGISAAKMQTDLQQKTPPAPAPTFHWSHIDSPDSVVFVRNLRAIGCPEPTIQRLMRAEIEDLHTLRLQEAAARLSGQALVNEQQRLTAEKQALLLAWSSPAPTSSAPSNSSIDRKHSAPATAAETAPPASAVITQVPAAFSFATPPDQVVTTEGGQIVLNTTLPEGLAPQQQQQLKIIQDDFMRTLDQATNEEEYQRLWQIARRRADERFASMFGGDTFIRTQLQAMQAAQQQKK
ncbi:MAG: hypothetical protein RLZZ476_1750 [Verrucomicrobiota bacterium]|jgi:hypothetical protein